MRIGLFALEDIPKDTELTFDYNFERFGSKKQNCYCESKNCRGYLGAKPKHMEAKSTFVNKKVNGKCSNTLLFLNLDLKSNPRKRKTSDNGHKRKQEVTLIEQNWGLPVPKKTKVSHTVDRISYVPFPPQVSFHFVR